MGREDEWPDDGETSQLSPKAQKLEKKNVTQRFRRPLGVNSGSVRLGRGTSRLPAYLS